MDEIKEYIKNQIKEKQKLKDIVDNLVNRGRNRNKMAFKVYLISTFRYLKIPAFFIIAIIILMMLFSLYTRLTMETYTSQEMYPDEPKDWVVENIDNNEKIEIDVAAITKGYSYIDGRKQIYDIPFTDKQTLFELNGYYQGEYFEKEYVKDNIVLMRIEKEMNPNNNIIEGFIVQRINDADTNNISAFIFLDHDWKENVPNTKVFWGSSYQYYTDYQFNEIKPGIYLFEIYDDPNRHFQEFDISAGGIAVGNLEEENIINNDIEGKTFIRLYS